MSQNPLPPRAGLNPGSVEVTPLFATPVLRFLLPEAATVNAALRQTILAREQSHPSTQHSNQGGYQSTWDMEQWGGMPVLAFRGVPIRTVDSILNAETRVV